MNIKEINISCIFCKKVHLDIYSDMECLQYQRDILAKAFKFMIFRESGNCKFYETEDAIDIIEKMKV